jgi:hypothetical protein
MILRKPMWGSEQAADIWALYYYLLYQTVPFEPKDYLPKDNNGYFYYENGERTSKRVYPSKPNIVLDCSPYDILHLISADLCRYLVDGTSTVNREHLRELLTTPVDEDTIRTKHFGFTLSSPPSGIRAQERAWKPVLEKLFNYDKLRGNESFSRLIQLLGFEVCPYCNRSFTTTVQQKDGTYYRQNQVDHYISKSTHPWFALSLLNLIPCCGSCNHKKGTGDDFVLYPYFEEFGVAYRFRTKPLSGLGYLTGELKSEDSFQIVIEQTPGTYLDDQYKQRVRNSIQAFGLSALYRDNHNEYVRKLFEQRFLISEAYLDSLCSSFPTHFKSREEIRHMLYLKSIREDQLDQAPLSKLTHDIDWEIDDLNECNYLRPMIGTKSEADY